ncbi:hypothetical protein [Staphylothermus hellenicus]|uniref:Uncharacterized protein n=1 Tax=Staphylothermus hellenicus (strain DSM 12710 / JCM 10830 / BK20S6-10-b1 / P8) TaxID=591019 RepID=D7D9Z4_STAHD|nr:hypothetical protein [Staphylothermus hellenicus]ADI32590.1 hypothetical protein Shell_1502 [Staphylothermus hellenicus DSM 12710]
MPRIVSGTILLEPYSLRYDEIGKLLCEALKQGIKQIFFNTKPGYSLVRIDGKAFYQPIAPLTIVFNGNSREASLTICSILENSRCIELLRDTWLDISSINTEILYKTYRLIEKGGREELRNNLTIHIKNINNEEYIGYMVMDYINTPLTWLTSRKEFTDPIYRGALEKYIKAYPRKIMLGFLIRENNMVEPYIVVEHKNNEIHVEIYKPAKPRIEKILFWHMVDLLL